MPWLTVQMMMVDQVSYKPSSGDKKKSGEKKRTVIKSKEELLKKINADAKNWE